MSEDELDELLSGVQRWSGLTGLWRLWRSIMSCQNVRIKTMCFLQGYEHLGVWGYWVLSLLRSGTRPVPTPHPSCTQALPRLTWLCSLARPKTWPKQTGCAITIWLVKTCSDTGVLHISYPKQRRAYYIYYSLLGILQITMHSWKLRTWKFPNYYLKEF